MQTFLIILGILLLLVLIAYITVFSKTILKSTIIQVSGETEADQYYYLPGAQVTLTVTAVIQVEKSAADKAIVSHRLIQFSFDPVVNIKPDTGKPVALRYEGNWFSNDELRITTSATALLENVTAVSEDRIGAIVAQITNAAVTGTGKRILESVAAEKTVTEITEVTRVFTITSDELAAPSITKSWLIPLTGAHEGDTQVADASFTLINTDAAVAEPVEAGMSYDGLLSRRLVTQKWTLQHPDADVVSFECMVPGPGSLLKIPVRRSYFVKKQQLPKFQQGLLVENNIVKPSEVEGLISIPLNIAKAILSVPAQLLQFKIAHTNQQTAYENALAALQTARESAGDKASADSLKKITEEWEEIKKKQYLNTAPVKQYRNEDPVPALGKLPPKPLPGLPATDKKEILETLELSDTEVEGFITPESHNWAAGITNWDEYDNLKANTCVPAAAAHLVKCWAHHSKLADKNIGLPDVLLALTAVAPQHDITDGCYMSEFMDYWKTTGLKGDKIDRFVPFKKQDSGLLTQAVYYFGGCMIGLQMPRSAIGKSRWDYPSADTAGDAVNWGGHTVCVLGYNGTDFSIISWGKLIQMSRAFYEQFNDESYAALSRSDWTTAADKSPADELGYQKLSGLLNKLYNA